jgi:hypothetical protein
MGGMAAIASVAVLGDGSLDAADAEPDATRAEIDPPRPLIVAVVADSTPPEAEMPVANRISVPFRRFLAARAFDAPPASSGRTPVTSNQGAWSVSSSRSLCS